MVEVERTLSPKQKALQLNLNPNVYGSFAEIGAGQETARHFFRAGGASGTIAKAMSAYDKDFSDAIYGKEGKGRYVCKPRLKKMLSHEYGLLDERLDREEHPTKTYFAFADTVTTINYTRTVQGHGWIGVRFQLRPDSPPNDIIMHIKLHEQDAKYQSETIGVLGVNLIYGAYNYHNDAVKLLKSLYDDLDVSQLEIDMIQFKGPDFKNVDNRLMSLHLVKNHMTDAVIFGHDGENLHPSQVLYKKNILAIRGSFRPVTKVNIEMITLGYKQFLEERKVDKEKLQVLFEITLNNLTAEGEIDEQDFLDRADILCSLGQTVLVSNYQEYYKLAQYLSQFSKERMGLIMGVPNLLEIFDDKYYRNLDGGILQAFGILHQRDIKIYLYPMQVTESSKLITSKNLPVHPRIKPLFDALTFNRRIVDLEGHTPEYLQIWSQKVLSMIRNGEDGWEELVPTYVDNIIKDKGLFGCKKTPQSNPDTAKEASNSEA
jgi:hypothetical protein